MLKSLSDFTYGKGKEQTTYDKLREKYDMSKIGAILDDFESEPVQLVIAGAGSGKTTLLKSAVALGLGDGLMVDTVSYQGIELPTPAKIWVSTFLKVGVDDLQNNIKAICYDFDVKVPDTLKISTLHSEFYSLLKELGVQIKLTTPAEDRAHLKKALLKLGLSKGNNYDNYDLGKIQSMISYVRNALEKAELQEDMQDFGLSLVDVRNLANTMKTIRESEGLLDFEDLQELLYTYLVVKPNQYIVDLVANRYDYIFLDEFQDVSYLQYEVLKCYFKGTKKIFIIGDDDQSIYSWRGGSIDIITKDILDDLKPKVYELGVNYRCPSNILEPAKTLIELNELRIGKKLESEVEGGIFNVVEFDEVQQQLDEVYNYTLESKAKGSSVAILTRNNSSLLPVVVKFEACGLDYNVKTTGITFTKGVMGKLLSLAHLVLMTSPTKIESSLKLLFKYDLDLQSIRNLEQYIIMNSCSIANIPDNIVKQLGLAMFQLKVQGKQDSELYKELISYIMQRELDEESKSSQDVVVHVKLILSIFEQHPDWSLFEFIKYMEFLENKVQARAVKDDENQNITLSTVHSYKGLESDNVVVFNTVVGEFPSKFSGLTEEERRVFYIALTRARHEMSVFTLEGKHSPFISEMQTTISKEGV